MSSFLKIKNVILFYSLHPFWIQQHIIHSYNIPLITYVYEENWKCFGHVRYNWTRYSGFIGIQCYKDHRKVIINFHNKQCRNIVFTNNPTVKHGQEVRLHPWEVMCYVPPLDKSCLRWNNKFDHKIRVATLNFSPEYLPGSHQQWYKCCNNSI